MELIRKNWIEKVKEIERLLNSREGIINEFDAELFGQMVKEVKVISLVEVEFMYKMGVMIKELL